MLLIADIDLSPEACDQRLRQAMTEISEDDRGWDQSTWGSTDLEIFPEMLEAGVWPCGTVACLFGRIAARAGMVRQGKQYSFSGLASRWWLEINDVGLELMAAHRAQDLEDEPGDNRIKFTLLGSILTGLSWHSCQRLAEGGNGLVELWTLVERYTAGRVRLPGRLAGVVQETDLRRLSTPIDHEHDLEEAAFQGE